MKYIKITNTGVITPQALHLLGASTKSNDATKIGQFGSGNKYALAYLLRNDYDIRVFGGNDEISLQLKPEVFRDTHFNVLHINGEKTSITTAMGKDWEFWQAMREVYCNALDEGEASLELVNNISPEQGVTQFYIENKSTVVDFMANFNNYFAENKEVLFECEDGRVLTKSGTTANIYRKGIRCFETQKVSSFDYDLNQVEINEDRLVRYYWTLESRLWNLIFQCTNKSVIRQILMDSSDSKFIEGSLSDYCDINSSKLSEEFKEVLKESRVAPIGMGGLLSTEELAQTMLIPTKIFNSIRGGISDENVPDAFKVGVNGEMFRKIDWTALYNEKIRKALEYLEVVGFAIEYPVNLARFDNKQILGAALKGEIYISEIGMEQGVGGIVKTLIEEYIHLKHNVKDETRGFQTAAIQELISYMSKVKAIAV